ncbi:CysB family HTH-type transcriptional regulator [Thiorhodospira sibirica]|uniref:CysB family HTH-type transcriptional regulator n=1 Tax=Thiorhodospira sibirica TaxID=154347 RepID=UPI00022C3FFE|nr:CysB family HTH-type transcriptional regulator [Thiorhodospira sibirica]
MNFQQLRIISETVKRNFNLTEVANALFTSQSGVSKHIRDLEEELGVQIFVRKGKRLLGLTEAGGELLEIVERMLLDTQNIKNLSCRFRHCEQGELIVATTHTQACYALPQVVVAFKTLFPKVHLVLHECNPREIKAMLVEGRADVGVATEALADVADLGSFPCYRWRHCVVVPREHALTQLPELSLEALAQYPILTYHEGIAGRSQIDRAFARAGLKPDIVLSSMDADVIKTYVRLDLGIGIIAPMAYSSLRDDGLHLLESAALFDMNTTRIALRRGYYLRGFAYRFIELCFSHIRSAQIEVWPHPPTHTDLQALAKHHPSRGVA